MSGSGEDHFTYSALFLLVNIGFTPALLDISFNKVNVMLVGSCHSARIVEPKSGAWKFVKKK